jgi:molybdenum cofactor synthesis domain-containing protein
MTTIDQTHSSPQSSSDSLSPIKTAGIILIGHELLSAKIKDKNAFYLMKRLRSLGVQVQRVLMIPDDSSIIAHEVAQASQDYDFVFTSGGVGPTHDDITLEAIAQAFNVDLYLDPQLADIIRNHFKERLTDAHLRMAHIPQESHLIWIEESSWPIYSMKNVYILPGIPQIFKAKFESIAHLFRHGHFYLRSMYLKLDEGSMADALAQVEREHQVSIGSYPRIDRDAPYRVRVTVESRSYHKVNQAVNQLCQSLTQVFLKVKKVQGVSIDHTNFDAQAWLVNLDDPCESLKE